MKKLNDQSQRLVGDCFFVRQGERMERCFYSEVLYVEASGCYCYIYRRDKSRILISYSLFMVELRLPKSMFRRVHRSYIVNLRAVDGFIGKTICIGEKIIPVSKPYREEVFGCFVIWELKTREEE